MENTELFLELLERKLQEGSGPSMKARLDELMEGARRGLELRQRFAPKIGRSFLLRPNAPR